MTAATMPAKHPVPTNTTLDAPAVATGGLGVVVEPPAGRLSSQDVREGSSCPLFLLFSALSQDLIRRCRLSPFRSNVGVITLGINEEGYMYYESSHDQMYDLI